MLPSLRIAIFAVAAALAAGAVEARTHALLVGVSGYTQDGASPLKGPANDVPLMWELLRHRGVEASSFHILADIVPDYASAMPRAGEPTKQNIIRALDSLVEDGAVGSGDTVILYFSGHGSQQPATQESLRFEPDGLDETFLPIDFGEWDPGAGTIRNALIDDEIASYVEALRGTGALIWVIFDSCHSGTMTRGSEAAGTEFRQLPPTLAGIPEDAIQEARDRASGRLGFEASVMTDRLELQSSEDQPGRLVALYAAQPFQIAVGKLLPPYQAGIKMDERVHGVLTFYLAQALNRDAGATFRDLAGPILAGYDRNRISATPLFEGDLDEATPGLDARKGHGILVTREDVPTLLRVEAGSLLGIAPGDQFALTAVDGDFSSGERRSLEIADVGLTQSSAKALSGFDDRPWSQQPNRFFGHPETLKIPFSLAVSPLSGPRATEDEFAAASLALGSIAAAGAYRLAFVSNGEPADVFPRVENGYIILLDGAGAWPDANLSDGARQRAFANLPSVRIVPEDSAKTLSDLERALGAIAVQRNLVAAVSEVALASRDGPLVVEAYFDRATSAEVPPGSPADAVDCAWPETSVLPEDAVAVDMSSPPGLLHCDTVFFVVRNEGQKPLFVTPLYTYSSRACISAIGGHEGSVSPFPLVPGEHRLFAIRLVSSETSDGYRPLPTGPEAVIILGAELDATMVNGLWQFAAHEEPTFDYLAQGCVDDFRPASSAAGQVAMRSASSDFSRLLYLASSSGSQAGDEGVVTRSAMQKVFAKIVRWQMMPPDISKEAM